MIVLDTNVLSELMRPKPSARVVAWIAQQPAAELFTRAVTEAEIFYGIELLGRGKRRDGLLAAAEGMFTEDFAGRVLAFEGDAARHFAKIAAHRRAVGRPISHADAQIVAITQAHGAKLATGNGADFVTAALPSSTPGKPRRAGHERWVTTKGTTGRSRAPGVQTRRFPQMPMDILVC